MSDADSRTLIGVRIVAEPRVVFATMAEAAPAVGEWVLVTIGDREHAGRVVIVQRDSAGETFPATHVIARSLHGEMPDVERGQQFGVGTVGVVPHLNRCDSTRMPPAGPLPGESIDLPDGPAMVMQVDWRKGQVELRKYHDDSLIIVPVSSIDTESGRPSSRGIEV